MSKMTALITKAPDDPKERREWASALTRLQVAMWVDGAYACEHCRKVYASVDDFLERNPRSAGMRDGAPIPVDDACYAAFASVSL